MSDIKKQDETTKAAYIAGRDAIVKRLGGKVVQEQALDVVMLMAHSLVTQNETLSKGIAMHNADIFCERLKALVAESQKDVSSDGFCGRMM